MTSQSPRWFERKFDFSFPAESLPTLCARLRETPMRLEQAVRDRPHELLVRKPDGKWSAQEHVGHLLDLEPLWMARLENYLAGDADLAPADLTNRKTDEAKYNQRAIEEILAEFRSARSLFVDRAANAKLVSAGRTLLHPRLKEPMRLVDHLYFVAEHDDHHIARIRELASSD